jgi:hypothetical protein
LKHNKRLEEIELNIDTSFQQILTSELKILWEARSTPTLGADGQATAASKDKDNKEKSLTNSFSESNQDALNRLASNSPLNPQPPAESKSAIPTFAAKLAAYLAETPSKSRT